MREKSCIINKQPRKHATTQEDKTRWKDMQIIPKNILTTKSNTNDYTLNYVIEPINKDNKT